MEEAFRTLTSRRPQPKERETLQRLYAEQKAYYDQQPKAADQVLSQGESPRDAELNAADLAATTLLVSTLMNHDEFVTKR